MGLDITVYEKLVLVKGGPYEAVEDLIDEDKGVLFVYVNACFPERAPGFHHGAYRAEGRSLSLAAGSYGGYGMWRDELARLLGFSRAEDVWALEGTPKAATCPFYELILFSDCEGVITGDVCAKLYNDFVRWEKKAEQHRVASDAYPSARWLEKYQEWKAAFELASHGGVVDFH